MTHHRGSAWEDASPVRTRVLHPCSALVPTLVLVCAGWLCAVESNQPGPSSQPTAVQVEAWLDEAQAAITAGRFQEAQGVLARAALLAPQDPGIGEMQARLAAIADGRGPTATVQPAVLIGWARAEVAQARNRAEIMARAGRPEDAIEQLEVVRQALRTRGLDNAEALTADLAAVDNQIRGYRQEQLEAAAIRGRGERDRVLAEAVARSAEETASIAGRRAEQLQRIRRLQIDGQRELALAECRQLVDQHPTDEESRLLYRDLLAEVHAARKLSTTESMNEIRQELAERLSRELMPTGFDGLPVYPADWSSRGGRRSDQLQADNAEAPWMSALRDALRARTSLNVEGQNGIDVLNSLATAARINLVIDPELAAGQERTVSLRAPSISVENALTWICQQMETRWSLTGGAVWVGRPQVEESSLAVYDIATLIYHGLDQPGKILKLGAGGGDAGGGNALFADSEEASKPPTPDEVVELLKASVTPLAWEDDHNGITVRGTTLYITAPPDTHRLLREFIRAQESTANLMVQVDTRWLTLNDDFMEEIGVDWKVGSLLSFPGVAGGLSRENRNSTFFGSTNNNLPATAVTQVTPLQSTGLNLEFGLIGPTQLSAVLYAAERNTRGRVLAAPSVTTLNGVRANVFVGEEVAYISDYEIVSSNYDPVIKVIPVGVSLDVKPFVSADRKYVTMDFQPAQTSIRLWTDFIVAPIVFPGGRFDDGVTRRRTFAGVATYPIELPNVTIREAGTTLTIPDRASALIGGFNKSIDQTAEARVPFLGDIPYLGRLFGHRGRYSEREKRYLMATVTIISNDEQEAKL